MRWLLVIAHGSRREESNQEVKDVVQLLTLGSATPFDAASTAFLELANPSIPDAIDSAVSAGAKQITVLPYFLAAGIHVVKDIPEILAAKLEQYPGIEFRLTQHIGAASTIIKAMESVVQAV